MSSAREKRLVAKALAEAARIMGKKTNTLSLLDYPCGAGRFAPLLASRVQGYLAGDHSPQMVDLTVQTLRDHGLADSIIGTTSGDLRKSTLDNACVDLAASIRLLHHFHKSEDRIAILSELRRISRGPLITTFRDADSLKLRLHKQKRQKAGKPCNRSMLSIPEFTQEAQQAGWNFHKAWHISSAFSGTCIALLTPLEG